MGVMVQPINHYSGDVEGWKEPNSKPYEVSEDRARDLEVGGLVKRVDVSAKVALPVVNKMAETPSNKGGTK